MPIDPELEQLAKEYRAANAGGSAPAGGGKPQQSGNEDWKLWGATSAPQGNESKGFLGELWNEVKSGPANLLQVGNSINQAVMHPGLAVNAMGAQIEGTAKKAKEAWQGGNKVKAVREAINTGINAVAPGLGTSSSDAGEMYDRGDYAGATGKTLGIGANVALGIKTPKIMEGVASAPQAVRDLTRVDPRVAINRSLRPVPNDPGFPKRVPETIKSIKQANGGATPGGITDGQLDVVGAANKAIAEHQAVLDKWLTRAKGVMVNGDEIVDATRQSIPKMMWEQDPQGARALIQQAQDAFGGKQYSVADFRDFLKTENADLSAFYRRAPGAQADAAVAGTPPGIQQAQTQRIRDVLYKALDPEGGGAGPRTIQTKTGDLIHMRDAALRRNNAIVAEQPLTPLGKVVDPMKAAVRAVLPGKATGAGIAFAEGSEGRSLPLIKRAFKAVGDEQPNALPEPGSPLYPTGNSARLLTSGDRITPPPADTSFVRGAQGMYPTGPNPARALPPASTRFAGPPGAAGAHPTTSASPLRAGSGPTLTPESPAGPPDTSYVRSVPGQRAVPQADPSVIPPGRTGSIIDMATQPAPRGTGADAEWWAKQPLTQPEIQARYQDLFSKAENLSPQRPVTVPATGTPEVVTRGVDARENIARQVLGGKPLTQATPTERNVIDQLVSEGYGSAPPRFAGGGIAGLHGPEQVTVGDGGEPEAIIPLSHIRMMGPQAQRHLLKGIGAHLGIGGRRVARTLGSEIGGRSGRYQESQ